MERPMVHWFALYVFGCLHMNKKKGVSLKCVPTNKWIISYISIWLHCWCLLCVWQEKGNSEVIVPWFRSHPATFPNEFNDILTSIPGEINREMMSSPCFQSKESDSLHVKKRWNCRGCSHFSLGEKVPPVGMVIRGLSPNSLCFMVFSARVSYHSAAEQILETHDWRQYFLSFVLEQQGIWKLIYSQKRKLVHFNKTSQV